MTLFIGEIEKQDYGTELFISYIRYDYTIGYYSIYCGSADNSGELDNHLGNDTENKEGTIKL